MVATSGNGIVATTQLDSLGRISSLTYTNSNNAVIDGFSYTYDNNSNVLSKTNLALNPLSETYSYDGLNRLQSFKRGSISGGTIASPSTSESWGLDALGNQRSVTLNNVTTYRAVNNQNQIISLSSSGTTNLGYDANGNTLKDQAAQTYTYDGWNRLVSVTTPGGDTISYSYDALGRMITRTDGTTGITTDLYYSNRGQVVEERQGTTVINQYVWSPFYVNQMVERDSSTYGRSYVEQDANYNITSLTDQYGNLVERNVYDPYGKQTVLNVIGSVLSGSSVGWVYGFQGGRTDPKTALALFSARWLTSLGTWLTQDPTGSIYINGANEYQDEVSNPANLVDPTGLAAEWHHLLPQQVFRQIFGNAIDDPEFGLFMDSKIHNELHSEDYNAIWQMWVDSRKARGQAITLDAARAFLAKIKKDVRFKNLLGTGVDATVKFCKGWRKSIDPKLLKALDKAVKRIPAMDVEQLEKLNQLLRKAAKVGAMSLPLVIGLIQGLSTGNDITSDPNFRAFVDNALAVAEDPSRAASEIYGNSYGNAKNSVGLTMSTLDGTQYISGGEIVEMLAQSFANLKSQLQP